MAHSLTFVPFYDDLVKFFGEDLSWVRMRADRTISRALRRRGLTAAAQGRTIHLTPTMAVARQERARAVVAHEVAHVLQQTRGARWTSAPATSDALEHEARRIGAAFAGGQASPSRHRDGPPLPERLQGHDSFEHRLLGDTPTNLLTTLVAGQGSPTSRDAALASACALLDYLGANPTNPDPATLSQLAGFPIRTMTLQGSGITLTYGELNTLADFLTSPAEIDSVEASVLMPILQMTRWAGWQKLNALRSSPAPQPDFISQLSTFCPGSVMSVVETKVLDYLTTGLGVGGRDHYTGSLARNACHFAPYTWWRWQAFYNVAVSNAQAAYANGGDPSLTRQAWLAHGYADHFLQDAFAAGHLVNKTLIMQWFIDWVADEWMPVYDWDAFKTLTATNQPGLSGMALYSPSYAGISTDPQTTEELPSQPQRMANTGVIAAAGLTQQEAYLGYLAMLDSTVCQIVTNQLHDVLNGRSVTASSSAAQNFVVWGDDTMLNGGTGATQASLAAQLSQQSIMDILAKGGTDTSWQQIFTYFPDQVLSEGQWVSLPQWHDPGGELWNLCRSDNVFDSWETWGFGAGSHALPDLGIISVDQPKSGAFKPNWGPVTGVGIPSVTLPATCAAFGSVFLFSQPAGGGTILCTSISDSLTAVTTTLTTDSPGPPAAALIDGLPTVVWVAADGTVSMASSTDGSNWTQTDTWAAISGADPIHGIALAEGAGTQYVAYVSTSGNQTSIALTSQASGGPWSATQVVPNSSQGTFPALCSDGQTLYVAFQHGKNGIYAGTLTSTWNGPSNRSNVQTMQGVSLAYVDGTPYMGYWGTNKKLNWETYTNGKWSNQSIPNLQSAGPVAIGADRSGNPCLYYSQSGVLASETRDQGVTWSNMAYTVGSYYSSTPPALVEFGELLYQFGTLNEQVLMSDLATQSTGTMAWGTVSAVDGLVSGAGRVGADVHVLPDNTEELWLAVTNGNDQSVMVASYDGSTWTARPAVTGATAGAGDVAVVEFNGTLYVFYESGTSLCYAAWNDATSSWTNLGAVPGVLSPASTTVTIIEDTLYIAYVGDNKASNYQRIYTVAWNGGTWNAPIAEGSDHGSSVSIAAFDDNLMLVFLGTNGQLNSMWSRSGGTSWNGKTNLGPAGYAPGLAVIDATVGDDQHAQALLGVFGSAGAYSGVLSRMMTAPGS